MYLWRDAKSVVFGKLGAILVKQSPKQYAGNRPKCLYAFFWYHTTPPDRWAIAANPKTQGRLPRQSK